MDPKIGAFFVFVTSIVAIGCFTGIVTTWLKTRVRRLDNRALEGRLAEIADRLGQLDNAVDTMAVEVERISEAQRFTTKLLAEGASARATSDLPARH